MDLYKEQCNGREYGVQSIRLRVSREAVKIVGTKGWWVGNELSGLGGRSSLSGPGYFGSASPCRVSTVWRAVTEYNRRAVGTKPGIFLVHKALCGVWRVAPMIRSIACILLLPGLDVLRIVTCCTRISWSSKTNERAPNPYGLQEAHFMLSSCLVAYPFIAARNWFSAPRWAIRVSPN